MLWRLGKFKRCRFNVLIFLVGFEISLCFEEVLSRRDRNVFNGSYFELAMTLSAFLIFNILQKLSVPFLIILHLIHHLINIDICWRGLQNMKLMLICGALFVKFMQLKFQVLQTSVELTSLHFNIKIIL